MLKNILFVGIGGAAGSILRYLVSFFVNKWHTGTFPFATFAVNIVGCFVIGLLFAFIEKNTVFASEIRMLLIAGFCGGFTTFSAFAAENLTLFQNGNYAILAIYILLSVIVGIAAVFLGKIILY
ncbi:putative fluoride ion transporter CrcB [Bacteroidia bacterium]|nr:putative fluoride ion transporter CrcB [Bacteroidia bacterium]